jgi:parallel beta-helix repeat protein
MFKKRIGILVLISFIVFGINFFGLETTFQDTKENSRLQSKNNFKMTRIQSFNDSSPIVITQDSDFNTWNGTGFPGNGTINDPIRIEGLNITASSGYLIYISGTTLHFRIAHNYLNGLTTSSYGIYLNNVLDGNIINNTITQAFDGIRINNGGNHHIANNSISYNRYMGIRALNSNFNFISNNTIFNHTEVGIELGGSGGSHHNTITKNTVYNNLGGIDADQFSSNNTLISNIVYLNVNGIWLKQYSTNNKVISNKVFNNPTGDGIRLLPSTSNNLVVNNTSFDNGWNGIAVEQGSNNNNVSFNNLYNNLKDGILVLGSDNNTIVHNTVNTSNWRGIAVEKDFGGDVGAKNNNVTFNTISNSSQFGILINTADSNIVTHNTVQFSTRNNIRIIFSDNNRLENNTLLNSGQYGFFSWESSNSSVNNNVLNSGLVFYGSLFAHFDQVSIDNNLVNGKPFIYWRDKIGGSVPQGGAQVFVFNSSDVNITDQDLSSEAVGIITAFSSNLIIQNNTVRDNRWGMLLLSNTNNSLIINNTATNNLGGIQLWGAHHNLATNNNAKNNTYDGFVLDASENNTLMNNSMTINGQSGFDVFNSYNNTFTYNNLTNNSFYGINLDIPSQNNQIFFNNFIGNNQGGIQALDNGSLNIFTNNYWNDWIAPDIDGDRIVDSPYFLDGSANNADNSPLTLPSSSQFLLKPTFLSPIIGKGIVSLFTGQVLLSWTDAVDTWSFNVSYNLYYSNDGGTLWTLIVSGLTETNYNWDTTSVSDGTFYELKLETVSNGSLIVNVTLQGYLAIDNTPPTVTVSSPVNLEYYSSEVTIILSGDAYLYLYYIESVDTVNQTWTSSTTRTLSEGTYTLHVYGFDFLGNVLHSSVIFNIDNTAPSVTISSPLDQSYDSSMVSIAFTGDADLYWFYIESVDTQNQTWNSETIRTLPDGTYTLHVFGFDTAGNVFHTTVTFTIDTTTPTSTLTTTPTTTISSSEPASSSQIITSSAWSILPFLISALIILPIRKYRKK